MKEIILAIASFIFVFSYFSCNKENNPLPVHNEELLIEQIVNTPSVEAVLARDLPSAISGYVKEHHSPLAIGLPFQAAPHGYEVFLENGLCLYFDQQGNHLNHDGLHGDMGNHHGGGDPGTNFCLAGDILNSNDLPQVVLDHIAAIYSNATIVTTVIKPSGNLAVEISTGEVLMFTASGNFFHFCDVQETGGHRHTHGIIGDPGWHCDAPGPGGHGHGNHGGMGIHPGPNEPCWGGTGISLDNLLTAINNYVSVNYSNADIEHARQAFNNNYFLRLSNCVRLVFNEDGSILFDSGA